MEQGLETWLRGPMVDVPPLLQPAAHALWQSWEEAQRYTQGFPETKLWERPKGVASVAFHLEHMAGVTDRMLTYAQNRTLSQEQYVYLAQEGVYAEGKNLERLIRHLNIQVEAALAYFKTLHGVDLLEPRFVGRKQLPSTLLGLLFHAGEHAQRHSGQLWVTVTMLK